MSSVLNLRHKIQGDLFRSRQLHRRNVRDDLRCGLEVVKEEFAVEVTAPEILKLCNRIKRRKQLDDTDLHRLSKGFLCSSENIILFLKTQGAFNVLIKELTGSSGVKQILVAEAICNLSLGDSLSCVKISKAIASYLMPMTTSQNTDLAETSLWILYNLMAGANELEDETFFTQGVDVKLLSALESNVNIHTKLETTRCLSVVVASPFLNEKYERLTKIVCKAVKNWTAESPRLIYEILQKLTPSEISRSNLEALVRLLIGSLASFEGASLLYVIRILGNLLVSSNIYLHIVSNICVVNCGELVKALNTLLSSDQVFYQETLWLLGNLINCNVETDNQHLCTGIIDCLIIPQTPPFEFRQYM